MTYFSNYPLTNYTFESAPIRVRDILKRSRFFTELRDISSLYSTYIIQDGERPEHVAYNIYGNASLHWVILVFNEMHDPYFEWPMSQVQLQNYLNEALGDFQNEIYYYVKDSIIVGQFTKIDLDNIPAIYTPPEPVLDAVPITFGEYITIENDKRTQIGILRPELLGEFVSMFKKSLLQ